MNRVLALHALATIGIASLVWCALAGGDATAVPLPFVHSGTSAEPLRWVCAALMAIEAATALHLVVTRDERSDWAAWSGAALLVIMWAAAWTLHTPALARALLASHGGSVLTIVALACAAVWTVRAALAAWMFVSPLELDL